MPFEQSKIAIAPAVIMHPNSKNIPKGPMTSKQLKKAYKERNAGPKMTKAEQRKEEQQIREAQRLELEKEKRLEREQRKREKKREEAAAAKAERKKMGVPEKSRWVRPSQNRITGFIALGKRNREDDIIMDADTTRENSVVGDMRPPKNERLSLDMADEDSGYASPDHDMDTAMLDITLPVNEDDVSTVDSQEDNQEHTLSNAVSQAKARPQTSDDELEPVNEQFHSSQFAEAPNFGTIGDAEESSFMSTGRFKTPALKKAVPPSPVRMLADPFQASQDYDAQCCDVEETTMRDNTLMADTEDVFTLSKAKDLPKLPSLKGEKTPVSKSIVRSVTYYDLFGRTDSSCKADEPSHDEIHKTYSPIKPRPSTSNIPKPRNPASFEADEDYDSYFLTQPSAPSAPKKTPKKASRPKSRPQISDDELLSQVTPAPTAAKFTSSAKKKTPKKASQPKARPKISDDEIDYDAYFATQELDAPLSPLFSRKEVQETPPRAIPQPMVKTKVVDPPKIDPFASSQDYFAMCGDDPFEATQVAPPPKVMEVVRKVTAAKPNTLRTVQQPGRPNIANTSARGQAVNSTTPRTMQPPAKPMEAKTPTNDPPPSTDYDGFFNPDAPHAKPFQKQLSVKTSTISKPLPKQFEASQDYFAMCGDDDDYDGDITPVLPAPKITMSPENMAKHTAYTAKQQAKMKPSARFPAKMPAPAALTGQKIGKFRLPVTPNTAQLQSAAQNTSRPMTAPKFKPHVPFKQIGTSVQRPQAYRHSAPPQPVPVLEVADDFEIVSGTQLMRELSENHESHLKTPQQPKETSKGTEHNLSQHLMWLINEGPRPGQQREPLKAVQQNMVRPPSFQEALSKQKRASYPPAHPANKPANTSASRFLPTKVEKEAATASKSAPSKNQAALRYQKPAPKAMSKPASKPVPSIEADDLMDLDFPSGTQLMREMADEEEQESRSRSAPVVPAPRPSQPPNVSIREATPVYKAFESNSQLMREMEEEEAEERQRRDTETPRSNQHLNTRAETPLCKSFESNSQILRELAEDEDELQTKKASETPCPPQQKQPLTQTSAKAPIKPLSFHIASDELQTLSQIEREMEEEVAQASKSKQLSKAPPKPVAETAKPVSFHFRSDDILSDSQIALELAQKETEAKTKQNETPMHNPGPSAQKPSLNTKTPAAPQPKFAPTAEGKPAVHPVTKQRWPKLRARAGDFRPLDPAQLSRELAHDDAEKAKLEAKYRNKAMSGWQGGWWQGPMDQNYDSEELLEMTRLEGMMMREAQNNPFAAWRAKVEYDIQYMDGCIHRPNENEVERRQVRELMRVGREDIPYGTLVLDMMAEEETQEKKKGQTKQAAPSNAQVKAQPKAVDLMEHPSWMALSAMKPAQRSTKAAAKGNWLTKTAETRNAVGSARKAAAKPSSKPVAAAPVAMAPTIENFEPEDDDAIMRELAEEEAASRQDTPAPVPPALSSSEVAAELLSRRRQTSSMRKSPFPTSRSTKGRRQFFGLATPAAKPATNMPPPSTPRTAPASTSRDPPPSTQPDPMAPSSTPLTVKRARKPLFFQEKPEDRAETVVFDSKLQADRDEQKRKEIEEERRRQDEWLRQLCGTQAAAEMT